MIIITSLSPKHTNSENQIKAIDSWANYGYIVSLNCAEEIDSIKATYGQIRFRTSGINFIETHKTIHNITGKHLVSINAMIDLAISHGQDLLLVNSDIIIPKLPELKTDGITLLSRFDYIDDMSVTKKFEAGFDVFYIPKDFLKLFPRSVYAMGAAWWDYWLPYICIQNGIPLYYPKGEYAFHQLHAVQYSFEEWNKMGEYFRTDFNFSRKMIIPQIATISINLINSKLK